MKIAINVEHNGGFGLSRKALLRFYELQGIPVFRYRRTEDNTQVVYCKLTDEEPKDETKDGVLYSLTDLGATCPLSYFNRRFQAMNWYYINRNDPALLHVIAELGHEANTPGCKIKVVEIPDDVDWQIDMYDGLEWVAEKHRTWH